MINALRPQTIRIVLADDHDLVRTGISALLAKIDGVEMIAEAGDGAELLALHDELEVVKRAVSMGACGYLMKDAPSFELEQALRGVMATGSYFSPSISQRLLQPSPPTPRDQLTARQIEILTLTAKGHAAKEIGHQLGLSSKTVDVHRAHIMERLQLHDIASLTKYAVREGLITL